MNLRKKGCALFLCVHSTVRHQKNKLGRRRRVQASTSLMIDGTSRYSLYSQSNRQKIFPLQSSFLCSNIQHGHTLKFWEFWDLMVRDSRVDNFCSTPHSWFLSSDMVRGKQGHHSAHSVLVFSRWRSNALDFWKAEK